MRAGRSLKKSVDVEGRVCCGMRASDEMVAMMPRWLGLETSSLKASCSSFETVIPDCIVPNRGPDDRRSSIHDFTIANK